MVTRLISALVVIVVIALRQLTAVCVLRLKPTLEAVIGLAFLLSKAFFASPTSGLSLIWSASGYFSFDLFFHP